MENNCLKEVQVGIGVRNGELLFEEGSSSQVGIGVNVQSLADYHLAFSVFSDQTCEM